MKVNELRIGNLVEYKITDSLDERKEWWELNPIDAFDLQHLVEFPKDGFFRPIPLTEEWLRKFGFEYSEIGYWYLAGFKGSLLPKKDYFQYMFFSQIVRDLNFCHELQNFFHSWANNELQITKTEHQLTLFHYEKP